MNPQTIRLIDDSNKQIGIFSYEEALEKAKEKGLDLLVITLKTDPPVYKLGNYEKVRYRKGKIIRRSSNIGHTQAKESGKQKRRKKNPLLLAKNKKAILRYC